MEKESNSTEANEYEATSRRYESWSSTRNISNQRDTKEINNFSYNNTNNTEDEVDFGQSFESDDGLIVTIGDIETNLPSQRNIHEYSKEYKPPSRTVTSYPTTKEIQERLEAALHEKQQLRQQQQQQRQQQSVENNHTNSSNWKQNNVYHSMNEGAARVMPSHSFDSNEFVILDLDVHTYPHNRMRKRVSIDTTAAEKLPPIIRNIVTNVAASSDGNLQAVKIPTVNFSTSAAAMTPTSTVAENLAYINQLPPPTYFNASKPSTSSTVAALSRNPPPAYFNASKPSTSLTSAAATVSSQNAAPTYFNASKLSTSFTTATAISRNPPPTYFNASKPSTSAATVSRNPPPAYFNASKPHTSSTAAATVSSQNTQPTYFNAPKPTSSTTAAATISLPPEFNPSIPPPNFRTNLPPPQPTTTSSNKHNDPINSVQALLRQYSNESNAKPCYPDRNTRVQHQKHIDQNRHRKPDRVGDNYRLPGYYFNSSKAVLARRRSRSRSPHDDDLQLQQQQNYGRNDMNEARSKLKFSKSAVIPDKSPYV